MLFPVNNLASLLDQTFAVALVASLLEDTLAMHEVSRSGNNEIDGAQYEVRSFLFLVAFVFHSSVSLP
jgi:hypothetical protein